MEAFRLPATISLTKSNAAEQLRRCAKKTILFYFAAAEVNKKAAKTHEAIILHSAVPDVQDIYTNIVFCKQ